MPKHDFKNSFAKSLNKAQGVKPPAGRPPLDEFVRKMESDEEEKQVKQVRKEAQPKSKPKPDRKRQPETDGFSCLGEDKVRLKNLIARSKTVGAKSNKSQIIRAGIWLMTEIPDAKFREILNSLPDIPTGRPPTRAKSRSED